MQRSVRGVRTRRSGLPGVNYNNFIKVDNYLNIRMNNSFWLKKVVGIEWNW